MPSTRTRIASRPASGIPATSSITPIARAWIRATPMTPCATARMVAADSATNPGARSGLMIRAKIASLLRAPASPNAMMTPAITNAARSWSMPPPMPATAPSIQSASSPTFGCMLCTSAGRSECAFDQNAWMSLPTIGHLSTPGRGAGICRVLAWTSCTNSCAASPSEPTSRPVGTTKSATPTRTISVDAHPCLPPSRYATRWWSGYIVTARITAQTVRVRNGEKIR